MEAFDQTEILELVSGCLAGDPQAKENLAQRIQNHVYFHCLKILVNRDDALDATQDILLTVFNSLDTLRSPQTFWLWLNRITANTCWSILKRERKEQFLQSEQFSRNLSEFYESIEDQTVPERIMDNEETKRIIKELVDGLSAPQRLCVLMYYYDEMSIKDIADALETTEGTIKSRLNYARKAIKEGVERYAAEGFKLYGLSPLPFLQYFLQQEAAEYALSPENAEHIAKAILAVGAGAAGAGAASLGGGTAATGVTIAMTKVAGGVVVNKGLLALAGLALAGTVGGGTLLHPAPPPVEAYSPPPAIVETTPTRTDILPVEEDLNRLPAEPPVSEPLPPAVSILPAETPPQRPEPVWGPVVDLKEPEERNRPDTNEAAEDSSNSGETGGALPLLPEPEPEPIPEPVPDPEPLPEPVPLPEPEPTPEPVPEPSPEQPPVPTLPQEPEPDIPQPTPIVTPDYVPNPRFGSYLGENSDGIHEFSSILRMDDPQLPYPFLYSQHYGRLEISDSARVGIRSNYIYPIAPGECEVRYYESNNQEGPFELIAIAYITVLPEKPITPDYSWGQYCETRDGVFYFEKTIQPGRIVSKTPYETGEFFIRAESSNPGVVKVSQQNHLTAVGAGSAEVRYYTRWAEGDGWTLSAVAQVTVPETVTKPKPAPAPITKELTVGYGYVGLFPADWDGELPGELKYSTSDGSIVRVDSDGNFNTQAPGKAAISAYDPNQPEQKYILNVEVKDELEWTYSLNDITLAPGDVIKYNFDSYQVASGVITYVYWKSQDPMVATVTDQTLYDCKIHANTPGTTEIEMELKAHIYTPFGAQDLPETISFLVHVEEPEPPEEITVYEKELTQFGYCSGYGFSSTFFFCWGEDLAGEWIFSSSDPEVAYIIGDGSFSTLSAGTAVLTAYDKNKPEVQYQMTIQVQDRFDWDYTLDDAAIYMEFSGGSFGFSSMAYTNSHCILKDTEWTSSDPEIVEVCFSLKNNCQLQGLKPGEADISGRVEFTVSTAAGERTMYDDVSFHVSVDYYRQTKSVEAGEFGYCSGYGYNGNFSDYWPGLSETMEYYSSDLNVIVINSSGAFTTLKAGTATLTASDPQEPEHQFAVNITVQDRFDWGITLEDLTMDYYGYPNGNKNVPVLHGITNLEMAPGTSLPGFAYWEPLDWNRLAVVKDPENPLLCSVTAKRQGEAAVKGTFAVTVEGCNEPVDFWVVVSFKVHVIYRD